MEEIYDNEDPPEDEKEVKNLPEKEQKNSQEVEENIVLEKKKDEKQEVVEKELWGRPAKYERIERQMKRTRIMSKKFR